MTGVDFSFSFSSFFDLEKTPFRRPKPNFDLESPDGDLTFGFSSGTSEIMTHFGIMIHFQTILKQ